jgi:hypothetical protein
MKNPAPELRRRALLRPGSGGAALPTIQAIYNRYGYLRESGEAFDKLAELIGRITASPSDNVVALGSRSIAG